MVTRLLICIICRDDSLEYIIELGDSRTRIGTTDYKTYFGHAPKLMYSGVVIKLSSDHKIFLGNQLLICITCRDNPAEYIIELGLHAWRLTGPAVQRLQVSEIIKHPHYNPHTIENDIAILAMATQPQETSAVHPVCISDIPHQQHSDKDCLVSGWGAVAEGELKLKIITLFNNKFTPSSCALK